VGIRVRLILDYTCKADQKFPSTGPFTVTWPDPPNFWPRKRRPDQAHSKQKSACRIPADKNKKYRIFSKQSDSP